MFRRPRRPFRPIPGRIPPRAAAHQQMLRNAFSATKSEDPAAMAKTFADLAAQAARNGQLRQAANLHARSAHLWLDANHIENALEQAEYAKETFRDTGMEKRAQEFQTRFEFHKQNPGKTNTALRHDDLPVKTTKAKSLPPLCSQCGAPLRSDEVEWIDEQSAECGFCGSVIKTITSE